MLPVATAAIGQEVLIDAATHKYFVTALRRNPKCRFDHRIWKISTLQADPGDLSLGAALRLGKHNGSASLAFGGRAINMRVFVSADALSARDAARSLASVGLRAGDVFSVSNGRREQHYELGRPGGKS